VCGTSCGSRGQPCCAGNQCNAGTFCLNGTCR
jgi:hypothetical protein